MPSITLADVEALRDVSPRRRHFAESSDALNANGSFSLSLRFDSVATLFEQETGLSALSGPYGPWCNLTDSDEIKRAKTWKSKRNDLVFLLDTLELSVALSFNFKSEGVYTGIGQAEHNTKQSAHEPSLKLLCESLEAAITDLPPLKAADAICAVPPAPEKNWDLPTEIVQRIAQACAKENLSSALKFAKKKESVKTLSLEDKWKSLEAADLRVNAKVKGKKIVLIDDKYQSGTTAQFVASKLYGAGAKSVLGLYCVKTWRDTDNT